MKPVVQVNDGIQTEIAALYDTSTNTFEPYHITEHPFCSGHTILPDGECYRHFVFLASNVANTAHACLYRVQNGQVANLCVQCR